MKNIKCLQYVMAIALFAVGCAKESGDVETNLVKHSLVFNLNTERTSLGESVDGRRKVLWSEGDRIAANGEVSHEAQIDESLATLATFEFDKALAYPCNVLYPASFYTSATTITLPNIQNAATESFATNTLPLVAVVEREGVQSSLSHLAGVVAIQIKRATDGDADMDAVRKIEFKGNASEQVSGTFTIDYATATLSPMENTQKSRCVAVFVTDEVAVEKATNIYIVVPARNYESGFKVRVIDSAGHYQEVKSKSNIEIKKGIIMEMPAFEFKPTHTQFDADLGQGGR